MSIPEGPAEPLQKLPGGMPRRYAEYMPVTSDAMVPPPTNAGGVRVALRRLAIPEPTLEQNFAHVLEVVRRGP